MNRLLLIAILALSSLTFAQEIRRPGADANPGAGTFAACSGTNASSVAMANAYDGGGDATSSQLISNANFGDNIYKVRRFTTWAAASGGYSALSLKITSACTDGGIGGTCAIQYSLSGGSAGSWTTLVSGGLWGLTTDTVTLSPSQDLSLLWVRVCSVGYQDNDTPGTGTLTLYDIRTEGTLGAPPAASSTRRKQRTQ